MVQIEIVKALWALNNQTLTYLGMFLEAYSRLNRRKTFIKLFLQLETSRADFLREQELLQRLLFAKADQVDQATLAAIVRLEDTSYPLFAETEVIQMRSLSYQATSFPSVDLYLRAVQKLLDAVLNVKVALFTGYDAYATDSVEKTVLMRDMYRQNEDNAFTDDDFEKSMRLEKSTETKVVEIICHNLDPHIERLAGLLILAEKVKDGTHNCHQLTP